MSNAEYVADRTALEYGRAVQTLAAELRAAAHRLENATVNSYITNRPAYMESSDRIAALLQSLPTGPAATGVRHAAATAELAAEHLSHEMAS